MFHSLCAHIYRIMKTPLYWLMIVWPIIFVSLFIAYFSVTSWSVEQKITGYFQILSLGIPGLITLLCAYTAQQEQQAGAYFNMLCVGKSRIRNFISIFIILFTLSGIGLVFASCGFYLFWGEMIPIAYAFTTILMLIPLASLLLIHMFISFKFGVAWSIGGGAIFLLIGALGVTGLLDKWWYYLPPTWAPRFVSLIIADYFHPDLNANIAVELRYGLMICLLASVIVAFLIPKWFHKWDGSSSAEDE